jgi:hypothetical protein
MPDLFKHLPKPPLSRGGKGVCLFIYSLPPQADVSWILRVALDDIAKKIRHAALDAASHLKKKHRIKCGVLRYFLDFYFFN